MAGTAAAPTYNFSTVLELTSLLVSLGVRPYYSMCYIPGPLQIAGDWKSGPSSMEGWKNLHEAFATAIRTAGHTATYEM